MVNPPGSGFDDIAEKFVATPFVLLDPRMCRGHGVDFKARDGDRLAGIESARIFRGDGEAIDDEFAVGFRDDELQLRIYAYERLEGVFVEMIGVIVAGSDDV